MHHELFEEMQSLIALNPDETTEDQEDRLADLLWLHDSGMAYFPEGFQSLAQGGE